MARTSTSLYEVEVLSWDKYNAKAKDKKVQWFRCSSNLFNDPEFIQLSPGAKLMWLYLLCQRAQCGPGVIRINPRMIPIACHIKPQSVLRALLEISELKWIQILNAPSSRARAERTNETKRTKRTNETDSANRTASSPPSSQKIISAYCSSWSARYTKGITSPVLQDKDIGQLSKFAKKVGEDRGLQIIEAYFNMPDHWFVTKRHDVWTMLSNLNAIIHFISTGKLFTKREINQLDLAVTNQSTLDSLKSGEI